MPNLQTPKKLASELARIADECGDPDAQKITYLFFLKRCLPELQLNTSVVKSHLGKAINAVLDQTDMEHIFCNYRRDSKDPAVYFYEEFIQAYDSKSARSRGVRYSPPAVVSYMTRGIEAILQSELGITLDDAVVVDPCCGTGTFLKHIKEHCKCSNFIGLELMPAAAEIANYLLNSPLTPTLYRQGGEGKEECEIRQGDALSLLDLDISDKPLVVIGNPPYSGHSANAGTVESMLADYKNNLKEKNPKWLQDDYVKFIRIAQHWMESAGKGIVAFITNHSFLFNPTFRVMRESLMRTFDQLYVLDLNGNAKINSEVFDENVFPIQMGVAISFMVKISARSECKIRYASIQCSRKEKLDRLSQLAFSETPWEDIHPIKPFHIFKPIDENLHDEYYGFSALSDLFEKSSVGFVTSRDSFAVDNDKEKLISRIAALKDDTISPDDIRSRYAVGDLDIGRARQILRNDPEWREKAVEVAYRPFDKRYTYLSREIMERPRLPFMENLLKDNIAMAIGRAGQVTGSHEWDVVFCVDCPADLNLFRRGGAMLYPKYLYKDRQRILNLKSEKEDLFYYIYAICHCTEYRRRYGDFLKIDYPRIPITKDAALFESLAALGKELIAVHLAPNVPMTGVSQMTIGGYSIPFGSAVSQTLKIRSRISDLISSNAPW